MSAEPFSCEVIAACLPTDPLCESLRNQRYILYICFHDILFTVSLFILPHSLRSKLSSSVGLVHPRRSKTLVFVLSSEVVFFGDCSSQILQYGQWLDAQQFWLEARNIFWHFLLVSGFMLWPCGQDSFSHLQLWNAMDPTLEASHSPTCLTSLIDIDRMLTVQILAALGQREGAASCLHNGSGWVTHCYHLQFFNIFQLCCMWYFGPGALACFFSCLV